MSHSMSAPPAYAAAVGAAAGVPVEPSPAAVAGVSFEHSAVAGEGWGGGELVCPGRELVAVLSSTAMRLPSDTLSPSLTFNSLTTPACVDGISIDALSLSTVTSDCSALMLSPGLTSSSITDTSFASPMSGTL